MFQNAIKVISDCRGGLQKRRNWRERDDLRDRLMMAETAPRSAWDEEEWRSGRGVAVMG